jgi:hypothetical protein
MSHCYFLSMEVSTIPDFWRRATIPGSRWCDITTLNVHAPTENIFSYLIGTNHAQKTQFYCCVEQITLKTNHVIFISPVPWHAHCCLATSSNIVPLLVDVKRESFAPLSSYTRYSIFDKKFQCQSRYERHFQINNWELEFSEISNDNGFRVVNVATSKNLIVKSTIFPHCNIHKFTWPSPDIKNHNQNEHIW